MYLFEGAGDQEDEERQRIEMGLEIRWNEGSEENSNSEHLSVSRSEASDYPVATGGSRGAATSLIQRCVKEEGTDETCMLFRKHKRSHCMFCLCVTRNTCAA